MKELRGMKRMNDTLLGIREIPDFNIECILSSGDKISFDITTASRFDVQFDGMYARYVITSCMLSDIFWNKIVRSNLNQDIDNFIIKANTIARRNDGMDIDFTFPDMEFSEMLIKYSTGNAQVVLTFLYGTPAEGENE
jgi:hypothetical protein